MTVRPQPHASSAQAERDLIRRGAVTLDELLLDGRVPDNTVGT